jgi:hypothetical protein
MNRGRPVLLRSGVLWYAHDPSPEDVRFADMQTLSRMCRWSGHTHTFYSVAEHCVRVARLLRERGCSTAVQLAGLCHDGHEVYPPGDVPGPLLAGDTPAASALREMERKAREAYRTALGLPWEFDPAVHEADLVMLHTEATFLMPPCDPIHWYGLPEPLAYMSEPWGEECAWEAWQRAYRDLGGVVLQ